MLGLKKGIEGKEIRLNALQEETLKEVGNLGAAKASDSLAKLTAVRTTIAVPYIKLIPLENFSSMILAPREVLASTFVKLFGDYPGGVLILYKKSSALILVDLMLNKPIGTTKSVSGDDLSAFIELSNILNNTYISALANFFDIKLKPGKPKLVLDIEYLLGKFKKESKNGNLYATVIGTKFILDKFKDVEGEFVLLFDVNSLTKLLKIVDKKVGGQKGDKIF